jgi:DNA-binding CsgD family transcriptional regulator
MITKSKGNNNFIVPLAKFRIGDQLYWIIPVTEESKNKQNQDHSSKNYNGYEIAGNIEIKERHHIIVKAQGQKNLSHLGKNLNPVDILTQRELQIVMLVADGRVNKQIADQLNISEWTVATHIRRIFAKLGVDNRAAMVFQCTSEIGKIL